MKSIILCLIIPFLYSCGSVKSPPATEMPAWQGKSRDEVTAAFTHLIPKTEEHRITYRDTDPIPSPARCTVIDCYPWTFGPRINCTYVFKFDAKSGSDRVVKATRSGNCRDKIKTESGL